MEIDFGSNSVLAINISWPDKVGRRWPGHHLVCMSSDRTMERVHATLITSRVTVRQRVFGPKQKLPPAVLCTATVHSSYALVEYVK